MPRKSQAKQDEVTRLRRLLSGACPTHGVVLGQIDWPLGCPDPDRYGEYVGCPRKDCDFEVLVEPGSKIDIGRISVDAPTKEEIAYLRKWLREENRWRPKRHVEYVSTGVYGVRGIVVYD